MRALTKYVLFAVVAVTALAFGQQPAEKAKVEKPEGQLARSLEELLSTALTNNPDVQVAEAKLREAEAELQRARLGLAQKLIERHAAVEAQKQLVKAVQAEYEMHVALQKTSTTSGSDLRRATTSLEKAKADLAQIEASLLALTGTVPGVAGLGRVAGDAGLGSGMAGFGGMPMGGPGMPGMMGGMAGGALGFGGGMGGFVPDEPQGRMPRAPMAGKIRTALELSVRIGEFKDAPLSGVLKHYQESAPNVPFLVNLGEKQKETINFPLKGELALGAALQALQDVVPGLHCYVREYGILITMDDAAPSDGMPLLDFWHKKPEGGKP